VEEAGDQEELVKPEDDDKADISESPKPGTYRKHSRSQYRYNPWNELST